MAALLLTKTAIAREKAVSVRVDPSTHVDDRVGDDVLTIVANLLDNAVDAAGAGGGVDIVVQRGQDGAALVRVSDDGPGVPEALRQRIFDIGISTKASVGHGNAHGIGLALVARVVARRGGSVAVTDRTGGGAVFTVELPPSGLLEAGQRSEVWHR